jgi:glycosyltransferase involved in cell wall biosynthesis
MERKPLIGIPVHNDLECFREMISSLINSTSYFDKIIIIESESTDGTKEFCDNLQRQYRFIEVIHTKKEGPLNAYNRLFELAIKLGKDLFLTQTDVIFPKLYKRDWLKIMSDIAQLEGVGAVIPINGGGISGPDYVDGFLWMGGWASYYPIEILNKVGGYDDMPNGWGVDIDHSYRISKIGKIVQFNYWVDHHMSNDRVHDSDEKGKKDASRYFKLKWGLK